MNSQTCPHCSKVISETPDLKVFDILVSQERCYAPSIRAKTADEAKAIALQLAEAYFKDEPWDEEIVIMDTFRDDGRECENDTHS